MFKSHWVQNVICENFRNEHGLIAVIINYYFYWNRLFNVWWVFKIDFISYIVSRSGYGKCTRRCGRVFERYSHLEYLVQGPLGRKKIQYNAALCEYARHPLYKEAQCWANRIIIIIK